MGLAEAEVVVGPNCVAIYVCVCVCVCLCSVNYTHTYWSVANEPSNHCTSMYAVYSHRKLWCVRPNKIITIVLEGEVHVHVRWLYCSCM